MTTYLVLRRRGPKWDRTRGFRDQTAWGQHAVYMDGLVQQGIVACEGPLEGTDIVVDLVIANTAQEARAAFIGDPWESMGLMTTEEPRAWRVWMGQDRLRLETEVTHANSRMPVTAKAMPSI